MPSDRTRGNGPKSEHRRCPPNIRKDFLTVRVTEHWVESLILEILKSHLDMGLGNLCWVARLKVVGPGNFQKSLHTSALLGLCGSMNSREKGPQTIRMLNSVLPACRQQENIWLSWHHPHTTGHRILSCPLTDLKTPHEAKNHNLNCDWSQNHKYINCWTPPNLKHRDVLPDRFKSLRYSTQHFSFHKGQVLW